MVKRAYGVSTGLWKAWSILDALRLPEVPAVMRMDDQQSCTYGKTNEWYERVLEKNAIEVD